MGLLDRVNKIWSGADFWDKKENAKQKAQFDAEEEKRKKREAQANKQPTVVTPTQRQKTVAPDMATPYKPPTPEQQANLRKTPRQVYQEVNTPKPQPKTGVEKELDAIKQQEMKRAVDETKRQSSWLNRTFMDRNWDKRAESLAMQRATAKYQDKNGYNRDSSVIGYAAKASDKAEEGRTSFINRSCRYWSCSGYGWFIRYPYPRRRHQPTKPSSY
jgi:hypothetical protein